MNIAQIEGNIQELSQRLASGGIESHDFIYELLLAYGHRKQSVTRLRSGERNMASRSNDPNHGEVIWKRHLYYKHVDGIALYEEIDRIRKEKLVTTNKIRFVIVTNFDQLLAVDTKTSDTLDISLADLPKQFDFFLPWAGMEKAVYQGENPADVKAAEKMAKLFDLIKGDNFDESNKDNAEALHGLNVFLTRLLFCFFAEDTEIFTENQFSLAIKSHTNGDGSDLSNYLNRLFTILNTADCDRPELPDYLASFPYVNGGLFAEDIPSPKFSAKSRRMLVECGSDLDWSDINPDIFGSMIQAVVHPDQRGGMGMHYTSVINIMKVIEPLFLNGLYEELEKVENSVIKLQLLQQRLGNLKIFDPACGSGNFLIIAYKELRKLEMEILKRLQELELGKTGQMLKPFSVIELSQFYGIELDDFAHEVAILSLWLCEHQMNTQFKIEFGEGIAALPLKKCGGITCGNATRLAWEQICSKDEGKEVYLLGNPPYLGYGRQSHEQKEDMAVVFPSTSNYKKLDYITCWLYKAANYISQTQNQFSFVTTNSICQGVQVSLLWPLIFDLDLDISFAHKSFLWVNNAKSNASVFVVIIGVKPNNLLKNKYIYSDGLKASAMNINPYLVDGKNTIVINTPKSISGLPQMVSGLKAGDDGNLILSLQEKVQLVEKYPAAERFIKKYVGASEFMNGVSRFCIWVTDETSAEAYRIPDLAARFRQCKEFRLASKKAATNKKAATAYAFDETNYKGTNSILIPQTGSERREYLPVGFLDRHTIISNGARAIYDAKPWMFGILSSKMHILWVKAVAGRLKMDMQYSNTLCYNSFPFPVLTENNKLELNNCVFKILEEREKHPEKTLAQLYSPEGMPTGLRIAHSANDSIVDRLYKTYGFERDEHRLDHLFKMYEQMTGGQNA
jgi:hypothetical protein